MYRKRVRTFVLTACLLAAAAFPISAQQYKIVDLGTLGGTSSRATSISEDGIVSGWATHPTSGKHAVIWDGSGIVDLGAPPGFTVSAAAAANDSGQVAANGEGSPQSYRGYQWESGLWTPIGVLPGTNESLASDIDSGGRIVGRSFVLGGEHRAVMWDAGILTDLGTLGGSSSAHAINEVGQVVGYSYVILPGGGQEQRGFVWEDGEMTALEPLPDHTGSSAADINELGQVCGSSSQFVSPYFTTTHACVWENGTAIALGSVPGYGRTSCADINNHGQVVGTGAGSLSGGPYKAFIWQDGVIQNLNDLVPGDTEWDLRHATGINDAGQIVGYGLRSPDDQYLRAFLLEPPTPCVDDFECDDGLFCNGAETCVSGWCQDGGDPCPGRVCDEGMDICESLACNFDGSCELGEDCNSCPDDCVSYDGFQACGDGICQPSNGEDCLSCASDCRGKQNGNPSKRFCCGADVDCTDARCNEDTWVCDDTPPVPYCCGDGACDPGEDQCICPVDCGAPTPTEGNCTDGVDNDCDGLTDGADTDCCGQRGDACSIDADCCSGNCKNSNKWPFIGTCR